LPALLSLGDLRARTQATQVGLGWSRLVFSWADLQRDPRTWDSLYFRDELLEAELARGRRVLRVLIKTPP
jgi:hypothetical protein